MYCMHCGEEIPDSSRFCKYCGKKVTEENIGAEKQVSAAAEPHIAANIPLTEAAVSVPVSEEFEITDGFFFKGVQPFKKFLIMVLGILLMFITALLVFTAKYPDLVSEVFNTIR